MTGLSPKSETKKMMIYGAAVIPIIDYINDHMGYNKKYLENLYGNFHRRKDQVNEIELVFRQILGIVVKGSVRKNAIVKNLRAQLKSLDQYFEKNTSKLGIILADKGGLGVVQYLTLLNPKISAPEKEMAYQIGYWMQLVDDKKTD